MDIRTNKRRVQHTLKSQNQRWTRAETAPESADSTGDRCADNDVGPLDATMVQPMPLMPLAPSNFEGD